MLTIASIMTFPVIDLSLLRNNNISIDYVNESVDLSKTVIWGIFEGTFSIANANEQFMNFVVHMAKSDKEKKKDNSSDPSEKEITNSAGQKVKRKYVEDQDELLEKAEDDFILQNLPNYNNICSLIEKLKKNIAKTLRSG